VGYDNLKKKYVGTFICNMGTGMSMMEGTYDPATKTFTYTMQCSDPMAGKTTTSRMIEKQTSPDTWMVEMYGPDKAGKEFKTMEMTYTRAK
jgi:hypothetical protein